MYLDVLSQLPLYCISSISQIIFLYWYGSWKYSLRRGLWFGRLIPCAFHTSPRQIPPVPLIPSRYSPLSGLMMILDYPLSSWLNIWDTLWKRCCSSRWNASSIEWIPAWRNAQHKSSMLSFTHGLVRKSPCKHLVLASPDGLSMQMLLPQTFSVFLRSWHIEFNIHLAGSNRYKDALLPFISTTHNVYTRTVRRIHWKWSLAALATEGRIGMFLVDGHNDNSWVMMYLRGTTVGISRQRYILWNGSIAPVSLHYSLLSPCEIGAAAYVYARALSYVPVADFS